ncbi:MAG: hypothetical protein PQJ59_16510 [Spirochaetales bacterium]|nr:hypothetical protein [Spirochaetales bacterium]
MMTLSVVPDDPALGEMIAAMNSVGTGMGLKNTERALDLIAQSVARSWQNAVGSDHRIERKKTAPFEHVVYSRDPVVHWMEYGLKSFDMKETHTKGPKSRVVKPRVRKGKVLNQWWQTRQDGSRYLVHAGDPYLIVPFRQHVKKMKEIQGDELKNAYSYVQSQMRKDDFTKSKVTASPADSTTQSKNANQEMVKRAEYSWGTKIEFPKVEDGVDKYKHLRGMTKMQGGEFMTFRVVSVNSPKNSWIHPGIPEKRYLRNILERGQEQISNIIGKALEKDLGA